jgi:hypothetical protein
MIVINFAHPLTEAQQAQLRELTGRPLDHIRDVPCHFDNARPYAQQVAERVDAAELSSAEWQQEAILVNPPAFAPAAAILIAELHGRMGYFPALIRIRPAAGSNPTHYEVAEIINLQAVRDQAREKR